MFSVSPSQLKPVLEYVQTQQEHHRTRTFQEEYRGFISFFSPYLFCCCWQVPPAISILNSKLEIRRRQAIAALVSISALLVLFPLRLFEIGNPDWRPLDWLHAAIVVFVTLALR